ncbi:hypothetical protein NKH71_07870 [Mesorhizobium sp. M0983]|uniref:hypothetical protein n=1 Tax=unclassified Mesorhizobium TaxID=325217 RepID=UPI00333CF345
MASFKESLRQEIRELEEELRANALNKKLQGLKEVLALYETSGEEGGRPNEMLQPIRTVTRVPSESRAKAMELAELFLRNRSGPTPTREILDHIVTHGGEIGGREPISNLSAMLSNSNLFQSHGRVGWTLASGDEDTEPLEDGFYNDVAESILADLDSDSLRELHNFIRSNDNIPHDIDGKLLSVAKKRLNRLLKDGEMRNLRRVFKDVLSLQTEIYE